MQTMDCSHKQQVAAPQQEVALPTDLGPLSNNPFKKHDPGSGLFAGAHAHTDD